MKFAFRQLLKNPGFTVVALLTLALGIGVNTTTFTLTNALLYRLPAVSEPGRLVEIYGTMPQNATATQSPANVRDELQQSTVFEQAAPWCFQSFSMAQHGEPASRVNGLSVGGSFFSALGVAPILGRTLNPSDDGPAHYDVIVVSERFWRENLGADPKVVGGTVRVNGTAVTVVGVMPAGIQDYMSWGSVDIWQPVGYAEDGWQVRNNDWLNVIARLKPGVSVAQAQA
ncbi:MAG TPA: ABC transporter permease, partial [Opitutaceae bacterium]